MDFQSLSRKELQILCKKNKIPANITNVAMADALAALTNVEGIEQVGNSQAVVQSPQTCKGSRRKPIKDPVETPGRVESNPDVFNETPAPALRTDRKRPTRSTTSISKTSQSPAEMLITPAATRTSRRKQPTLEAKEISLVSRPYSTRRSARFIQDPPQLSEMNKATQTTEPSTQESSPLLEKPTIQDVKAASTVVAESEKSVEGIQVSAEVATQDSSNSNQQHKSNKLQGDTNAQTKICLEGIQVANNKAEDVPDADSSPDLEDIQVANNKAEDVPDVLNLAADSSIMQENSLESKISAFSDSEFNQADSHSELSSFVEVLGSETALGKTTCSEGEEFVANGEVVVVSTDTRNNVSEPVPSRVDDGGSQTDLQLEHPTPEKTDHSDGQQFVGNGNNMAISAGTPNNDAYQVPSPTDDSLSGEENEIKLCVDGAFGANPSDDASGANVAQVLIPEDTSHSLELPGSLVGVTLEKADNSKGDDIVPTSANVKQFLIPEASDYLGVADEDVGLFSDLVNNMDAGANTNPVMEQQTQQLEGENVGSMKSKSENGSCDESPLEELKDLEFHLTGESVADPPESEIPGICKADLPVKGAEVEIVKPDKEIFSRHSEAQGWEAKGYVNQFVGGAVVDIPFSAVTNSIPQVTTSDSKHVLNQNKKASPVSKMALKVFEEDKEENASGGLSKRKNTSRLNVMSVAEDKAILGSKLVDENKENTTSVSGGMGGKSGQNVAVTEEKKESKEKGMNNISLRKLKKMFKESLVNNKELMQFEKPRPALQTLTDNCLVEDGNN